MYAIRSYYVDLYDSDQEIERRTGADIGWVFDVEGEEGFRRREEQVISDLSEMQGIILATGGGAIKSALTRNRLSARGIVVYLETPIEKQLARTQRDKKRPLCVITSYSIHYTKLYDSSPFVQPDTSQPVDPTVPHAVEPVPASNGSSSGTDDLF